MCVLKEDWPICLFDIVRQRQQRYGAWGVILSMSKKKKMYKPVFNFGYAHSKCFLGLKWKKKKDSQFLAFTYLVEFSDIFRGQKSVLQWYLMQENQVRIKSNQPNTTISVDINSTPPACSCTCYSLHIIYIPFQHLFFFVFIRVVCGVCL